VVHEDCDAVTGLHAVPGQSPGEAVGPRVQPRVGDGAARPFHGDRVRRLPGLLFEELCHGHVRQRWDRVVAVPGISFAVDRRSPVSMNRRWPPVPLPTISVPQAF